MLIVLLRSSKNIFVNFTFDKRQFSTLIELDPAEAVSKSRSLLKIGRDVAF